MRTKEEGGKERKKGMRIEVEGEGRKGRTGMKEEEGKGK